MRNNTLKCEAVLLRMFNRILCDVLEKLCCHADNAPTLSHLVLLNAHHLLLQACLCSAHHCTAMPLIGHAQRAHTSQTTASYI